MQQCVYHTHDLLEEARKHKKKNGYRNMLDKWHVDVKYRKSLSDDGWIEEHFIQNDKKSLEDHSKMTTWQKRSRNGKSWKNSLNQEGIQGPMNHRNAMIEAKLKMQKNCRTNFQQSLEMERERRHNTIHTTWIVFTRQHSQM